MTAEAWRLILSPQADGPENFALDEALAIAGGGPCLRLYGWAGVCLSLGRFQKLTSDFDLSALDREGVTLVRRPTGGRAIVHQPLDLTYSVTAPGDHWLAREGILESYRALNEALVAGLRLIGIQAVPLERSPAPAGPDTNLACFEKAYRHEVYVGQRKIVASAQSRAAGDFLQQGTLPFTRTGSLFARFVTLPKVERAALASRLDSMTATPAEALGRPVSWQEAALALAQGFARVFNVTFREDQPTGQEEALAQRIKEQRYARWEWTASGGRDVQGPGA